MKLSYKVGLALAASGLAAMPHAALAQKIVLSGDINIANPLDGSGGAPGIDPGNQRFFQNILGTGSQVVQENGYSDFSAGDSESAINNFYNALTGVTSTEVSGPITASTLAGANLFIGALPDIAYTPAEMSALHNFSANGGTIFFLGDNKDFAPLLAADGYINSALTSLGSSLQIVPDDIDGGNFFTATGANIAADPLTTGVMSFSYAAASHVSGGTPVFFTQTGSTPFVAETGFAPVPEASTAGSFGLLLLVGLSGTLASGGRRKVSGWLSQ